MKRFFKIGCLFTFLILAAVLSCACSCNHECDEWQTVITPTCQSAGTKFGICKKCDEPIVESIPFTEHSYSESILKEATCSESGEKKFTCVFCEESYTAEYTVLGAHSFTESIITPATCSSEGTKQYTCSVCELSYTETYSDGGGHTYVETILAHATCKSDGAKQFVCSGCGDMYTEEYPSVIYEPSELYNVAKKSVAEIKCYDRLGNRLLLGTGFVYSADGKIITNYHVIKNAYTIKVSLGGSTYTAKTILAYDESVDIAVIKINASGLTPLYICSEPVAVGETVYAIGSSMGMTDTFSQGMVSYFGRVIDGVTYIQHTAASSTGNSGGPLLNKYCEVIGINRMSASDSQNLNFAVFVTALSELSYDDPVTPAELYARKTAPKVQLVEFIKAEGSYDSTNKLYLVKFGKIYSSDNTSVSQLYLTYNADTNDIQLTNYVMTQNKQYMIVIDVPSDFTGHKWGYMDQNNCVMIGDINASAFVAGGSLEYTDTNVNDSEKIASILEFSQEVICIALTNFEASMRAEGLTVKASDIGFTSFADSLE